MEMKKSTRYEMRDTRYENGSALILVVVLTSLLAIVGVMFVMVARVDRIATSGISENKTLDSAVETVIAKISQVLVSDVPGVAGQPDYYDYPDGENAWLASLEPYDAEPNLLVDDYRWRQISDVTGFLERKGFESQSVEVELPDSQRPRLSERWVRDYPQINVDEDGDFLDKDGALATEGLWADADGDGVADSKWIELEGINSSKGKTIYAAIRVIDNGAMLNVNTVYADPGVPDQRKGDKLTDIYIDGLVKTGTNDITKFLDNRGNFGDAQLYHDEVSRRIENPDTTTGHQYSLYDISDELELRNRYMVFNESVFTRLESKDPPSLCFGNSLRHDNLWTPVDDPCAFKSWKRHVDPDHPDNLGLDPNESDNLYSFRKLLTTYNFDRIIHPYGGKMVNVNRDGAGLIYSAIWAALFTADPNFKDIDEIAAQTAVNLIDFRDNNSDVTPLPDVNGITYYGFERPCVYISELAHRFRLFMPPSGPIGALPTIYKSYAIELHKPYSEDSDPNANDWKLAIDVGTPPSGPIGAPVGAKEYDINWSSGEQFHVMLKEDSGAPLTPSIDDSNAGVQDCDDDLTFDEDDIINLRRRVRLDDGNDIWITVDSKRVPGASAVSGWLIPDPNAIARSIERDINRHKCIRRLWDTAGGAGSPTLGQNNNYFGGGSVIQAHPENEDFTNIGEIGMVFRENAYGGIGLSDAEADVRINLADPNYQRIFQYLTVFDPSSDTINNDGDYKDGFENTDEIALDETPELKIPGRININTAPWYVIAQLPWVSGELAQAIVAYRDKTAVTDQNNVNIIDYSDRDAATDIDGLREEPGFASIGELATVVNDSGEDDYSMRYYILGDEENDDLAGFPDLTPGGSLDDGAEDDFEERDVIFARISNLVTVRSDVFTAYILVRIGADGPQKRVMAILDRSNVYPPEGGKVRIVALHAVPDPR